MMGKTGKKLIVVVGGANLDIQGKSFGPFLVGDSNPGRVQTTSGGVGRNIAENLARMGKSETSQNDVNTPVFDIKLISAFSGDTDSDFLREECRNVGVGIDESFLFTDNITARYLCLLDNSGKVQGAVSDMSIMESLGPKEIATRQALFDEADCLVLDANLREDTILWIAGRYGRKSGLIGKTGEGPILVVDPVSATKARKLRATFGEFHIAKPNLAEAAIIAGINSDQPEEIRDRLETTGRLPEELYISLGEKGIFFGSTSRGRGYVELPDAVSRPKTVNRSGAGDAACAALVWASLGCPVSGDFGSSENPHPDFKARCAIAAALIAAADTATVNKSISARVILEMVNTQEDLYE
jgi:pseudouridine kinase